MNIAITIRHTSKDRDIWLQLDEETDRIIGAVHSDTEPTIDGSWFKNVTRFGISGVFSESNDVLISFNELAEIVSIETYQPRQPDVVGQISGVPTEIEHKGKQFRCVLWGKGGKRRLYVKTPKDNDLGYYDLVTNEWFDSGNYTWSSPEAEQEFCTKVADAAKGIEIK